MARPQERLPRLNIIQASSMQQQQAMFSPALGTGMQQQFHPPPFNPMGNNPLQTPMQQFFNHNIQQAPGRPGHQSRASIALGGPGLPPNGFVTPVQGHFSRPSMMLGPGQPFVPQNGPHGRSHKRQISIGGPPKAVLGGPARKVSPNPAAMAAVAVSAMKKKIIVNLPKETVKGEEKDEDTRAEFARIPLPHYEDQDQQVAPPELCSRESYPPESWRTQPPGSIDVFLPTKDTWEVLKQQVIEAKLEKLGVERGNGSNVPHIYAPHARSASISSPADPAVLLWKLNKLHQAQSSNNSLAASPQPQSASVGLTPPPPGANLYQNRHGHTMSLAQPPTYLTPGFSPMTPQYNPFASSAASMDGASVTSDNISRPTSAVSDIGIYAPQGRVPFEGPPLSAIPKSDSRPDFIRGFGLDIPEEEEPEEESFALDLADESGNTGDTEDEDGDEPQDMDIDETDRATSMGGTTAPQSRLHSRHVSRLSAALSLRSVGGNFGAIITEDGSSVHQSSPPRRPGVLKAFKNVQDGDDLDAAAQDWTGSEEEGYLGTETSDDESLGEFSNPSDEERARRQRVERRSRRKVPREQREDIVVVDQPRRIPNFPRPPENTLVFGVPLQGRLPEDIISNPSEESLTLGNLAHPHHNHHYLPAALGADGGFFVPRPANGTASPRLHPLPHSRATSAQYSLHDPAMAHSRAPSEALPSVSHSQNALLNQSTSSYGGGGGGRRESLNPFAKPFVFGRPLDDVVSAPQASTPPPPHSVTSSHTRVSSLGKPLNIAAPEFKPRGLPSSAEFTFRQPDGPPMPLGTPPFPEPELALPEHMQERLMETTESSPAFRTQGREKRQRLGSTDSVEIVEEGDSIASFRSFKFPSAVNSPQNTLRHHHQHSASQLSQHQPTHSSVEPFSFESFSNVAHFPSIRPAAPLPEGESDDEVDDTGKENIPPAMEDGEYEVTLPPPSATKPKRAPIPLDFKHPVSGNTVPAGLFKALVNNVINHNGNNDDRLRRPVRSRLASTEIFEHMNRPSMDDSNIQMISKGHRTVTDPVKRSSSASAGDDDVFSGSRKHSRRRSSLPDALRDDLSTPSRSPSVHPQDLTTRLELQHLSDALAHTLDDKFTSLRRELLSITRESAANTSQSQVGLTPSSEAMISEVVSLFRSQLQESAARSMEESHMEARGEMDFQMIKDIIDEGHAEIVGIIKHQIHDSFYQQQRHQHKQSSTDSHLLVRDVVAPIVEAVGDRTTRAVVEAISELSARHDAIEKGTPGRERDLLLNDIISVLTPTLNDLRQDPIDYEFLTSQLTQAVKPHISQLIDLASDKRETAKLIMEQLMPRLPSLKSEVDAMSAQIINEVRRIVGPIDPFEIKEQVSDLVVARLDSRFAVLDKAFNVDAVTSKVTEGVSQLLENLNTVPAALQEVLAAQEKSRTEQEQAANERQEKLLVSVSAVPAQLESKLDDLRVAQDGVVGRIEQIIASAPKPDTEAIEIKPILEALATESKEVSARNAELLVQQQAISNKVEGIPEVVKSHIAALQDTITELIASRDAPRRELDDLRKLSADYQIQLAKARAQHGQVRVEKDVLGEKLSAIEAERDQFKNKVAELENAVNAKSTEVVTLGARTSELDEALAKALGRLKEADVATQADKKHIAELEKTVKETAVESHSLKSKVESLELQVTFSNRDRDLARQTLDDLRKEHQNLSAQQGHWEDLRQATAKIDMLTNLIGDADNEELQNLRRYRDRTKGLETDYSALQKRFKELETKAANSDRTATTAKQTLTQAQQRSTEWERRAREYEGDLELTRTKLEQAEQTQTQLDADYSLLKIQFEEREAEDRLAQDRDQKQRDQISALEAKVVRLQEELLKSRTNRGAPQSRVASLASSHSPSPYRTNGNAALPPARPDSRASVNTVNTVNGRNPSISASDRRLSSYTPGANGSAAPPSQPSVWDSMHAPTNDTQSISQYSSATSSIHAPKSRYPHLGPSTPKSRNPSAYSSRYSRAAAPSPSPSIVSAAPTQGDDGWWA
ncbi:hypothetical protein FA15DRAFT_626187 [Coprinopsis marcescibilis]|uniref:Uncharacterized protein n=1 Tax=Coprinopsis marcescibilis TaxID=230819 RepID=A0A5C3KJ73_COPMA|nr:hypothetical protein FA15DRAFT_626187 [Coprinopsis marcescibilis]